MDLSPKFEAALLYACEAHRAQRRKGKNVPYVAHLLGVASIALEFGASEDEAIGALLHDVAEDCGGEPRLAEVRARFGEAVAAIVRECSDFVSLDGEEDEAPWRQRKEEYLAAIGGKSSAARVVSCADKLHNATDILRDLRRVGVDATFMRFNGGREGTLWYYRALVVAFRESGTCGDLVAELDCVVSEMVEVARR